MTTNPSLNVFLGILVVLLLPLSTQAEDENYCANAEAKAVWEQLVKKHPDDLEIHRLHALRHGICWKIERGDITIEQGVEIFGRERDAMIIKELEEATRSKKKRPL